MVDRHYQKYLYRTGRGKRLARRRRGRVPRSMKRSIKQHSYRFRSDEPNNIIYDQFGTGAQFYNTDDYMLINAGLLGTQASPQIFTAAMAFALQDIPNISTYTALYDQYRITKVHIKIQPLSNIADTPKINWNSGVPTIGSENVVGILHDAIDYNDFGFLDASNPLVTIASLQRYSSYRNRNFWQKSHVRVIKPHIAIDDVDQGNGKWLDCNAPNVPHFGYKMIMELPNLPPSVTGGTGNSYTFAFKMVITYSVEFRFPV